MKITKAINLSFANSSDATSQITIPFKVAKIHCKAIGYVCNNQPVAGAAQYGYIVSELVDMQPLCLFYNDDTYSYTSGTDIELTLYTPRTINGTYTFSLRKVDGTAYTPTGGGTDLVVLICEFNSEDEL